MRLIIAYVTEKEQVFVWTSENSYDVTQDAIATYLPFSPMNLLLRMKPTRGWAAQSKDMMLPRRWYASPLGSSIERLVPTSMKQTYVPSHFIEMGNQPNIGFLNLYHKIACIANKQLSKVSYSWTLEDDQSSPCLMCKTRKQNFL